MGMLSGLDKHVHGCCMGYIPKAPSFFTCLIIRNRLEKSSMSMLARQYSVPVLHTFFQASSPSIRARLQILPLSFIFFSLYKWLSLVPKRSCSISEIR